MGGLFHSYLVTPVAVGTCVAHQSGVSTDFTLLCLFTGQLTTLVTVLALSLPTPRLCPLTPSNIPRYFLQQQCFVLKKNLLSC